MSKSDCNEIPTRSGQPRLELEEGSTGDARRARSPIPLRARTEGRKDGQSRARDLPSGLALMKTRTLRPAGTRWEGRAVRFPEKAARRSAESRGQGSLVPAPAGHIALRRDRRRRRRLLLLGFPPAIRGNSEVDPRRQRGSEPLRARGAAGELPGTRHRPARSSHAVLSSGLSRRRLLPLGRESACARGRSSAQQPVGAGGQRVGGYERGAPLRSEAPAPAAESAAMSPPAPAAGGGGSLGGGTERPRVAEQTLSRKGGRSLSEAASRGFKGGGAGASGYPGFTGDDPERSRLPPWRKAGKTLARDHRCSAPSPKGHSRPEDFREGTRAGLSASVPKCREYGLKVRHTHRVRPPRVGSITLQNRFRRLGGSVTAALSLVAQVVLSFSSSRSRGAAKPGFL